MSWFFYYSPFVLDGYMDPEYFEHYLKLLFGIFILNQSSISLASIQLSFQLLTAFVSQFQTLYDPRYMSFNIHSLRHLPDLVYDLGPLWVTSCFPLENLLGIMLKFFHGTRQVGLQIYSKIAQSIIISNLVSNLEEQSTVKNFCTKLRTIGKRAALNREIAPKTYILGKLKRLDDVPNDVVQNFNEIGINLELYSNVFSFKRLRIANQIIYTRNHERHVSHHSHLIKFNDIDEVRFGYVESFIKICNCNVHNCEINCNNSKFFILLKRVRLNNIYSTSINMCSSRWYSNQENYNNKIIVSYLYKIIGEANNELIPIESIDGLCFHISIGNDSYIAELCNATEYNE